MNHWKSHKKCHMVISIKMAFTITTTVTHTTTLNECNLRICQPLSTVAQEEPLSNQMSRISSPRTNSFVVSKPL